MGKSLAMLGIGRSSITTVSSPDGESLDLDVLEEELRALEGEPAVIVACARAANTGAFDPLGAVADLAAAYGVWMHVDAAFGLFARTTRRVSALADGIERADSVSADGHKWLNVPHDCGFAFVAYGTWLAPSFCASADYIGQWDGGSPGYGNLGPKMSRRARSMPVWATLHAYGQRGYRQLVEHCLDVTDYLAAQVDDAPDLELLMDPPLNVVCFRYRPRGHTDEGLDDLNRRVGDAVLADGRVHVGTTVYDGRSALRAVVINWRTTREDIDLLLDVIGDLGARLTER